MSNKKSYMNKSNLITEGFFDKLKTLLGFDSKKTKILKKDKKINQNLKNLNKSWSNIEKHIAKQYGQKVKFNKFKLSDFI